jgi:hypothetical protein
MLEFKIKNSGIAEAWCLKHLGPRLYYLHNKIGGEGWRIMRAHRSPEILLCIEDDKKALMAMLTLSDNNG